MGSVNNKQEMKTAQIMSRNLNGMTVRQNHKDGMFNANDLLTVYNEINSSNKRLDTFLKTKATAEYINVIREQLAQKSNTPKKGELEFPLVHAVDVKQVIRTSRGRVNGGTWMHPYLFLDFAMWLSPEFKYKCMEWLHDQLIAFRDQAGDSFREVNSALSANGEKRQIEYINEARMINDIVFGSSKGGQRNTATEKQLDMLSKIQKADIKLITKGLSFVQRQKNLQVLKDLLD